MTTSFRRHCGTAAVAAIAIAILTALASPAGATWSLVWADEFNGTGLDYANWAPDIGNGCPDLCGWGNSELQYYRAQNVAVTGGNLVLTTRAESIGAMPSPRARSPRATSARSSTGASRCAPSCPPAAACGPRSG